MAHVANTAIKEDVIDFELTKNKLLRNSGVRLIGQGDNLGDVFGVRIFQDGVAFNLDGYSVQGYFIRQNGTTVLINGSAVNGNVAIVTLPQACYVYEGPFSLAIKIVGTITETLRVIDGVVTKTTTETMIDPGSVVPDISQLLAKIQQMEQATTAANTAATNANNVATNIIAPAYSTSATYAVGNYCIYNGYLYRCTTAITTAEEWTAGHWVSVKLGNDVVDLKSAFTELASNSVMCESGSWDWVIHAKVANSTRIRNVAPIFIDNYEKMISPSGYDLYWQAFDINGTALNQAWATGTDLVFSSLPTGTAFINFAYRKTNASSQDITSEVATVQSSISLIKKADTEFSNTNSRIDGIEYLLNLAPDITAQNVFIYDNDNKVYADTNNGFVLNAYRITKGKRYACSGVSTAAFNTFNYALVYYGIVYTDNPISLAVGTAFAFAAKTSFAKKTTPSNYADAFEALNDGYIVQLVITDKYANSVQGISNNQYDILNDTVQDLKYREKRHIETTLFNSEFTNAEFSALNSWNVDTGKITTGTSGIANKAIVNKSFAIEERETIIRFKTSDSSAKIGFGYISPAYAGGSSIYYVDFSSGKMAICEAFTDTSALPSDRVSESITLVAEREYLAVLSKVKKRNTFTIIDSLTGERTAIYTESVSTNSTLNEFAGGRQNGFPFVVLLSGDNAEVLRWYITTPFASPLIAVYGDSITEGDRLTNYQKRYVDWLKNDFGDLNVSVSGMSGSNIDTVTVQIEDEIPVTKPTIVIVAIGTNGTNTEAKLNALKTYIESQGAITIFNHIPMLPNTEAQTKNAVIDLIQTEHALMDVATANNNIVSDGQNTALFADLIHPNENGHKAMYERFIIDTSIYHS